MSNPIIRIHDLETNEIIDREMTKAEFEEYQAAEVAKALEEATKAELAALKQSVLDRLGITEDEAKALLA